MLFRAVLRPGARGLALPAVLLLLLSASASPASAMGFDLTGLNVVDSFTLDQGSTGDPSTDPVIVVGDVAYADWDVFSVMGFDSDLSQYTVSKFGDGIRITGPFESVGWSMMELGFVVHSISGAPLATASLGVGVEASAQGIAGVDPELLFERMGNTEIGELEALVQGGDGTAMDSADISPFELHNLLVRKKIVADFDDEQGTGNEFARVLYVDQAFATVPEPGVLALLALGLLGIFRARRA